MMISDKEEAHKHNKVVKRCLSRQYLGVGGSHVIYRMVRNFYYSCHFPTLIKRNILTIGIETVHDEDEYF